ncbi:unnamed protein product [Pleuronectes platessa]|uniref:Uncharacterized protein n=1 Tax=Pleuronectes platessa TaxID=8262 RepID=A0A9N7UGE3_PLEPL|nr:unnamed protein product [Pleuronectes platessa]
MALDHPPPSSNPLLGETVRLPGSMASVSSRANALLPSPRGDGASEAGPMEPGLTLPTLCIRVKLGSCGERLVSRGSPPRRSACLGGNLDCSRLKVSSELTRGQSDGGSGGDTVRSGLSEAATLADPSRYVIASADPPLPRTSPHRTVSPPLPRLHRREVSNAPREEEGTQDGTSVVRGQGSDTDPLQVTRGSVGDYRVPHRAGEDLGTCHGLLDEGRVDKTEEAREEGEREQMLGQTGTESGDVVGLSDWECGRE